jgi:hypothetical protein
MAFTINRDKMENDTGGYEKEKIVLDQGIHAVRLVSYVEMGMHLPMFKGKRALYGADSKKHGEPKPAELVINLVFEFPNAEHSSQFPQMYKTSIPMKNGDFLNKLAVSEALMNGDLSMKYAMRSQFMKYLNAMNDAHSMNADGLHEFVGKDFLCTITHKIGDKQDAEGNLPIYVNMNPESLVSTKFKNPVTGKVEDVIVPPTVGTYCPSFFWDSPKVEAWKKIPAFIQNAMKKATDYPGSALEAMVTGMPVDVPKTNKNPEPFDDGVPA